ELSPVLTSPFRTAPFVVSPAQNVFAWPKMPSAAQGAPLFGLGGKSIRIGNAVPAAVAPTRIDAAMATAAVSHAKRIMSPPPLLTAFCRCGDPNASAAAASAP